MEQEGVRAGDPVWPAPLAVLIAASVAFGLVTAQLDPFTRPAEVMVGTVSIAMVGLAVWAGWVRRGPIGEAVARPRGRAWRVGLVGWAVLIAGIGLFQLAQFQSNPRETYPTLSSLASIAFGHWPVRAAAIVAWLVLGGVIVGGRRR